LAPDDAIRSLPAFSRDSTAAVLHRLHLQLSVPRMKETKAMFPAADLSLARDSSFDSFDDRDFAAHFETAAAPMLLQEMLAQNDVVYNLKACVHDSTAAAH
jgi:hypothetical protein